MVQAKSIIDLSGRLKQLARRAHKTGQDEIAFDLRHAANALTRLATMLVSADNNDPKRKRSC
jgi:hypothetical protein